jgi:hypothetical protein
MIRPDDPDLYKLAKRMAQSNGGDTAKIYSKIGGSFSAEKRTKTEIYSKPEETLFSRNEEQFAPQWVKQQPNEKEKEETADTKAEMKNGKKLLNKIYGGSAPKATPSKPKVVKLKSPIGDAELEQYSDPKMVQARAVKRFGKTAKIYRSNSKSKKYAIQAPDGSFVSFGQMGYEDFTKHRDPVRRANYLSRATNISGNWKSNPFSPNNLAIHLLW